MTINVHVHSKPDKEVLALLNQILKNQKKIMGTIQEQFDELRSRLDAATNEIAADLQKWKDEAAKGSLSAQSLTDMGSTITRLEEMGKDSENPIPE